MIDRNDNLFTKESASGDHLEVAALEKIIGNVVDSVERAREDIYFISEEARQEANRMAAQILALKEEAKALIISVEACEQEEKKARLRLMRVSSEFERYDEQDIKEAYDMARNMQVQLSILREREKYLIQHRDEMERNLRRLENIAHKAENMVDRVNVVLKMLQSNTDEITGPMEDTMENQQVGLWVIQAQEEERRRIARELHDGPAQSLANLVMRLNLIERLWDDDQRWARNEVVSLAGVVRDNITEVRRVIFDLRPLALEDYGLIPSLKNYLDGYEEKHGLKPHFMFFGDERRFPLSIEIALFRLIQEALSNVKKHAGVKEVLVKLEVVQGFATVIVRDYGDGFETSEGYISGHYGLLGMKERVELLGGEFKVSSQIGQGTRVFARIPLGEGK
ncbi:MAG: histidine kinase [Syntrophomonadaceae bacterium]|nr:histidine kinase [Syntrophomonadaceae bacterium]